MEDHDDTREAFAEYLRLEGFEVLEFGTAEAALQAAGDVVPDLLVIDHTLPNMDGLEAARRLRADPRMLSLPILFLTGHTHVEGCDEVVADILRKPASPEELVATLRRLLSASRS